MTRDREVKSCEDFFRIKRNLRFDPNAYLAPPPLSSGGFDEKKQHFCDKSAYINIFWDGDP